VHVGNTINAALRRLGFEKDEMTGHGFRSAASSMLNEAGLWNADAIERQLAHVDGDAVRKVYARADFWDERVRMMVWWADRCEKCVAARRFNSSAIFALNVPLYIFTMHRVRISAKFRLLLCKANKAQLIDIVD